MRNRHFPRLCGSCAAPMGGQDDSCWRCGAPWASEARPRPPLPIRRDRGKAPVSRRPVAPARQVREAGAGVGPTPLFTRHMRGAIEAGRDRRNQRHLAGPRRGAAPVAPARAPNGRVAATIAARVRRSADDRADTLRWVDEGGSHAREAAVIP